MWDSSDWIPLLSDSNWKLQNRAFCETSFKNGTRKLRNEAFLWEVIQKWQVDCDLHVRIPIRFNDFDVDAAKVLRLPGNFLQRNTSGMQNLQLYRLSVRDLKHQAYRARTPAPATRKASLRTIKINHACVFETLTNPCTCYAFCNLSKSLRTLVETHFKRQKVVRHLVVQMILTYFDFQIALFAAAWLELTARAQNSKNCRSFD